MDDFSYICRVCLILCKETYFDIFSSLWIKQNILYSDMFSNCTKIKPREDDGLPKIICKDCSRQLKRTYAFNILCEDSDKRLKSLLERKPSLAHLATETEIKDEVKEEASEVMPILQNKEESVTPLLDKNGVIKEAFKAEPHYDNDDFWDADDDNIVLGEIKSKEDTNDKKYLENLINQKPKKRGRKKKVTDESASNNSRLPHQCDICGKFLSTKSNLKAHKICHTDLRPYKCTECPAAFRGYSALFQHKKVHSGETPYHCEYCPKRFSRRTGLVNHIRVHTGEKLYSCDICFKNFIQSAQLSIHMKRHKGEKTFLCQDCGKGFPIKSDLRIHQRIHNGEKPYSCHLCTKTFATSGNLSIHVRIHNKEIRYHCKECQRGFVTCSAYNVHVKRHKGQRDYHCECGKTFYTSSALKQHKVVHTGEKKYQCKICEKKFTQTSHLSRHFKRDHAKPNAPIPSSDQYKVVLTNHSVPVFGLNDKSQSSGSTVKCEGLKNNNIIFQSLKNN